MKINRVKEYFEDSPNYLWKDGEIIGILSRKKIVKEMLKGKRFKNLLDVPCGNGLLSLPLIDIAEQLTLRKE